MQQNSSTAEGAPTVPAETTTPAPSRSPRLTELDGLRGLLLLLMTVNHMPSPLRVWTSQPLGFTSAAEGFVFLSAFLSGLIYCRRAAKVGEEGARHAILQRAGVVLRAHFITFATVFVVIGLWLAPGITPFANMVRPIMEDPAKAAVMGGLLVYQPAMLDILPLYVMLLAVTPLCFWIAARWGWRWLIGGSAVLWALSQRPPLKLKLLDWTALGHPWDFGYFDQFAWQFLWVLGLALGAWYFRKPTDEPLVDFRKPLPQVAAVACVIPFVYLFAARHGFIHFNLDAWWWTLDKWRLGPLRMASFLLHLGFFVTLANVLRPIGQSAWLTYLGRHSLPVFCGHLIVALLATGFVEQYQLGDATCYALVAAGIASLYAAAWATDLPIWQPSWWKALVGTKARA
jgi:hypothetical protein